LPVEPQYIPKACFSVQKCDFAVRYKAVHAFSDELAFFQQKIFFPFHMDDKSSENNQKV